ncbi:hypothetical protein F5882DRAFT_305334 [Hyaloscypha sp. PMI_1271]|nr:hypothetical protein F5882DRAFT_305334 [Hyaloscypha sp. PMI_1271]
MQPPFHALNYTDGIRAAILGLTKDVHLVGTKYSWLGSILYFGYLFERFQSTHSCVLYLSWQFEYQTSFAMQKFSFAKWLGANIFLWGCTCMALGGCNNLSPLAALRFMLGMLESCSTSASYNA